MQDDSAQERNRSRRAKELVDVLVREGYAVTAARGVPGYTAPAPVRNTEFGSLSPHRPDVVGRDPKSGRTVFGVVRLTLGELASAEAIEGYHVLLDRDAEIEDRASLLYILIPPALLAECTTLITHQIHREYWHRVIPVAAGPDAAGPAGTGSAHPG